MAKNTSKTIATLIIGAAIGSCIGYIIGSDKEKRQDQVDALRYKIKSLKEKLGRNTADIEDEIYNA